jgi:hypothetical protein
MIWLRRSTGRKHAQVNFAEFVFTVEDMGVLEYFHDFPQDAGMVCMDVCYGFNYTQLNESSLPNSPIQMKALCSTAHCETYILVHYHIIHHVDGGCKIHKNAEATSVCDMDKS